MLSPALRRLMMRGVMVSLLLRHTPQIAVFSSATGKPSARMVT